MSAEVKLYEEKFIGYLRANFFSSANARNKFISVDKADKCRNEGTEAESTLSFVVSAIFFLKS